MTKRNHVVVRSLALLCVAGVGCLPATNSFDPNAPVDQQARASITGRVVEAAAGERPSIPNASVVVRLVDGTFVSATFDGESFAARELVPGAVTLEVTAPGYAFQTLALELGPGEIRDLEVALVPSFDVPGSGRITGVATREARLEHGGIEVRATEVLDEGVTRAPRVFTGLTNDSGGFDLGAPAGRYEVAYSATNYQVTSGGEHDVVEDQVVDVGATQLPFIPGIAQGQVIVEEDGTLLEPVLVGLLGGVVGIAEVEPDGSGQFTINPAPPGEFFVRAHAGARYVPATSTNLLTVVPGDAPSVLEEPLVLRRARGTVTGYVLLSAPPNGNHAGTLVQVAGTSYSGTTDAAGRFTIVDVPTGSYVLAASQTGYISDDIPGVAIEHNVTTIATTEASPLRLSRQVGDFTVGNGFTNTLEVALDVTAPEAAARVRSANAPFSDDTTGFVDYDPGEPLLHTLEGADGLKTIYLQFELGDGTLGTVLEGTVRLDRVPPTISALTLGDGSGFSTHPAGTVLVTVSASDGATGTGVDRLQFREGDDSFPEPDTDPNTRPYGDAFELTFIDGGTDGLRSLFVRVTDAAGNVSTTSTADITLDRAAPQIVGLQLVCDATVGALVCDRTTIGLDFDPGGASAYIAVFDNVAPPLTDVRWRQVTSPLNAFVVLPAIEAQQTVYVFGRDVAGNVSSSAQAAITLDLTAPGSPFLQIAGGASAIGTTTAVPLAVFATGATEMAFAIGDASLLATAARVPYNENPTLDLGAVSGLVTVYAAFWDEAGNASGTVSDTVTVDTSAPVFGGTPVEIAGGAPFTSTSSVSVVIDVDEGEQMQLSIDGAPGPWQPFSPQSVALLSPGDCPGASPGCKEVCVTVRNEAGLEAGPSCVSITLDTTPPSLPIIGTPPGTLDDPNATVALATPSTDDFFDRYEYLLEATDITAWTQLAFNGANEASVSLATSGSSDPALDAAVNVVRLRAVDAAGNASPEASVTLVVDQTAPAAPSVLEPGPVDVNANSYAMVFASDNAAVLDATFSHYEVARVVSVGAPVFTATAQLDTLFFALDQGAVGAPCGAVPCLNTLYVRAVDDAGNTSSSVAVDVYEDSVVPSRPELSPGEAALTGDVARLELRTPAADQGAAGLQYEVTGGGIVQPLIFDEAATQLVVPLVRDSVNQICARAVDPAGNGGAEDCVSIEQLSTFEIASQLEPSALDVHGDFIGWVEDDDDIQLHHIPTLQTWSLRQENFNAAGGGLLPLDGYVADFRVQSDLDYAWLMGVVSASSDGTFLRIWALRLRDLLAGEDGTGFTRYQLWDTTESGGFPGLANGDVRAAFEPSTLSVVAFVDTEGFGSTGTHQLQGVLDFTQGYLGGNPEYVALSDDGIELCLGTRPALRTVAGTTWVAWCEVAPDGTSGRYMRNTLGSTPGTPEEIGVTVPSAGDTFGDIEGFSAPLIDDDYIWWVVYDGTSAEGDAWRIPHGGPTAAQVPELVGRVTKLYDVNQDQLVFAGTAGLPEAESIQTWRYDLASGAFTQLTTSIVPTLDGAGDGVRTVWYDRANLTGTVSLVSRAKMTWVSHHQGIKAFAITDGDHMVWGDARDALDMYRYDFDAPDTNLETTFLQAPLDVETLRDDSLAIGAGTLVMPRVTGSAGMSSIVDVFAIDVVTGTEVQVSDRSSTDPIVGVDITSTGDRLAFVQDGTVFVSDLVAGTWSTPAGVSVVDDYDTPGVYEVQTMDSANQIEAEGDFVVFTATYDEGGGMFTQRSYCLDLTGANGYASAFEEGGQAVNTDVITLGRADRPTPDRVWAAFQHDRYPLDDIDLVGQQGEVTVFCPLACDGGPVCAPGEEVIIYGGLSFGPYEPSAVSPRMGPNGIGVMQPVGFVAGVEGAISVIDLEQNIRYAVTYNALGGALRSVTSVGSGRAGLSSTELGALDVWEIELPR